jgi:sugar phosphate isomerase/epimerase
MNQPISRRALLTRTAAAGVAAAVPFRAESSPAKPPFRFSLNAATLMGHKLSLPDFVDTAAKAGYDGIEPWFRDMDAFVKDGGNLDDLAKRIRDRNLTVENVMSFAEWIVDDDERRAKALENLKREMDLVTRLGGKRIAAPPAGATKQTDFNLVKAAERYRAVLELGATMGIVPQLEIWGGSKTLSRMSEAAFVATESGHPNACLLLDVYHLYKGGSDFHSLTLLNGARMHVFHLNDYPADPPRETITDAARVYPGDGIAPLANIFRDLRAIGFRGALSVELFNRTYWQQDALAVARTALEKTRALVKAG